MVSQRGRLAIAAAVASLSFSGAVQAQAMYWDVNGATAGAGGTAPNGTWDNGTGFDDQAVAQVPTTNWNAASDGVGTGTQVWDQTSQLSDAIFSAGNDATDLYTVTLKAFNVMAVNSLTVEEGTLDFAQSQASAVSFASSSATTQITLEPGTTLRGPLAMFTGFPTGSSNILLKNGSTLRNETTGNGGTYIGSGTFAPPITIDANASATIRSDANAGNSASILRGPILGGGGTTTMVKTGPADMRTAVTSHTFTKLVINAGMFRNTVNLDPDGVGPLEPVETPGGAGPFGFVPTSLLVDNITLNNNAGIGATFATVLHANRGIVLGANGGRLDTQNSNLRIDGPISGPGGLSLDWGIAGATFTSALATHTLAGTNTYGGSTTLNRGSLTVTGGAAIPDGSSIVFAPPGISGAEAGGTFLVNASETVGSLAGGNDTFGVVDIAAGQTLTIGADNTSTNFNGRFAGGGDLVKTGTGVQTLGSGVAGTATGTMTINGGRIQSTKPVNLQAYNAPGKIVVNPGAAIGVTVGASPNWTATDVDTLRANATFNSNPGNSAQLAIDTSSAGGSFTYASSMAGAHGLTKLGTGTLDLTGNNSYTGTTRVEAGTLLVNKMHVGSAVNIQGGLLRVRESSPDYASGHPSGDPAMVSQPSSLTIAAGATLDITNNDVIVDYSGTSPAGDLEALVRSAYNVNGTWDGPGITSSIAAVDSNYVVAIADNATLAAPFGTGQGGPLFNGVDVDLDTVLIKFTHRVDINLDGLITPDDASVFGTNYDESITSGFTFAMGDVDFDGACTPNDAAIFGTFYDEALAQLPEPGSLAALGLLGLGLTRRRRA